MSLEKKGSVPPLSYSSMNEILGCEQKYAFRKVLKVEQDDDYAQETDAMDIGSVMHKCLEDCYHDLTGFKITTLKREIEAYPQTLDFEQHGPLLWAMLRRYKVMHEALGLKAIAVETELTSSGEFKGFVDLVLDEKDGIWVTDLKTAATISKFLLARLKDDRQLNLYVHYYKKLVKPKKKILGAKYRVVTKSRLKRKKSETFAAFSNRIYDGIRAYEYTVPADILDTVTAVDAFKAVSKRQKQLHKNAVATRNYGFCESFHRPCEFWSRCHGQNFTAESKVIQKVF